MLDLNHAALDYAARGWPVFPVRLIRRSPIKVDKVPFTQNGLKDATRDRAQITRWWERWPDASPGIATGDPSGIVILDIDVKGSVNGFDTLGNELGRSVLPETPMVITITGGSQLYFATIEIEIRNSAGALGTGLDVRGTGGFVVAPAPGNGYRWDPHYNFDTVALMPAPAWLGHRPPKVCRLDFNNVSGQRLYHRFDPQAFLDEACRRIRYAPDGTKHTTCRQETFRVATLVRDGLLTERETRHALEAEIMPLGMRADGHTDRVDKYYNLAFAEGLAAPAMKARR
jgi:Bifunctional DNA primase/polymerase, N-terminal